MENMFAIYYVLILPINFNFYINKEYQIFHVNINKDIKVLHYQS